ncbi:hypothetical protein SLEP1_g59915, partial [Rubroshorea leprosula]
LFLSQAQYIRDLLDKFGMAEAKPISSPMAIAALQLHQGLKLSDPSSYRSLVGSLQYLNLTRPDITFAVNRLSQFLHAPSDVHMQVAKRILRYLEGSVFNGLLLRRQPLSPLHAFSYSDWAGDKDTLQSTTGFIVFLGSTPISWKACKQKAVARSSTEAEYRALAAASSESNPVTHTRMKHIAIDLHFVRELMDRKLLRVSHISTVNQLADGLTKPLSSAWFSQLKSKIGVTDGSSILQGHMTETKPVINSSNSHS